MGPGGEEKGRGREGEREEGVLQYDFKPQLYTSS